MIKSAQQIQMTSGKHLCLLVSGQPHIHQGRHTGWEVSVDGEFNSSVIFTISANISDFGQFWVVIEANYVCDFGQYFISMAKLSYHITMFTT